MNQVNSKNNSFDYRSKNKHDDWRQKQHKGLEKIKYKNNVTSQIPQSTKLQRHFSEMKFDIPTSKPQAMPDLTKGKVIVSLAIMYVGYEFVKQMGTIALNSAGTSPGFTLMLLGSVLISEVGASPSPLPTLCDNGLGMLSMAQLIDSKVKIDPAVPAKFHKDLQCDQVKEKIRQTVESFQTSEARIKRVLCQPEFEVQCISSERMKTKYPTAEYGAAYFDLSDKKMYVANDELDDVLISHEFIHADHYYRYTQAPFMEKNPYKASLPFYPYSEENMRKYHEALDKGDERINDFKMLREKMIDEEKLSQDQMERLNNYEKAAKDCLGEFISTEELDYTAYDLFVAKGWRPGMKGVKMKTETGSKAEILEIKQTSNSTLLVIRRNEPSYAVSHTSEMVQQMLLHEIYRNIPSGLKLIERDAFTFQHLSENAMETFYPEAYKIRTRDLKKSESHKTEL